MATLKLSITTSKPTATLVRDFQRSTSNKRSVVQGIAQFLQSICWGGQLVPSVAVSVDESATPASGTFTLASVVATDVCSINGVSFTAVASGATGNQFNVGADDEETAANLAAAINASVTALVSGYVTASAEAEVVTVTSTFRGIAGNQTTIASADATITASGARLTGGAADSAAKTYSF